MKFKSFVCIEGLRAWMAWWVVLGHGIQLATAPGWLWGRGVDILLRNYLGVNVFIMVSGFVIAHLLFEKNEPYRVYIVRRLFRIAPVYLFCMAVAVAQMDAHRFVYLELPFSEAHAMRVARFLSTEENLGWHLLAHATLLHGMIPNFILPWSESSILAPAWSLSLEWQFYLVAPFLVAALSGRYRNAALTLAGCFVLFLISSRYLKDQFQNPAFLFLSIKYFLIGIGTRIALGRVRGKGVFLLFLADLFLIWLKPYEGAIWTVWTVFCAFEAGLLDSWPRLTGLVRLPWKILAANPIVSALGRWSYSTYLVHIPIFVLVVIAGVEVIGLPSAGQMQGLVFLAILCVPAVSAAMYRWIEKPGIRLGTKLAARVSGHKTGGR